MAGKILTKNQVALLGELGQEKSLTKLFYLSGGTALAEFYLQHRFSEDLDFFAEKEFEVLPLNVFLRSLKRKLGISKVDFQQSYNRNLFFLHIGDDALKVEFTYFPFPRLEKGLPYGSLQIDSLLDIAVNKLFTIYQRTRARDYIDLYLICREKNFSIEDLKKKARIKFDWHIDPIQLGTQFLKAQEAMDYPRMIKKLSEQEWRKFFIEEAKKLKGKVIE